VAAVDDEAARFEGSDADAAAPAPAQVRRQFARVDVDIVRPRDGHEGRKRCSWVPLPKPT